MSEKRGRPRVEINQEDFEKLCRLQCTLIEIAGFFECCEDTVENWCKRTYGRLFSDVYKEISATGKVSLRRLQFRSAERGNVTMQIWLGKQYLGQKESQSISLNTDVESEGIFSAIQKGLVKDES